MATLFYRSRFHFIIILMKKGFEKYIWSGCTALVTGASSGMGLEYSRQLAATGCHVVMVSNQKEELERYADELHQSFSSWVIYSQPNPRPVLIPRTRGMI